MVSESLHEYFSIWNVNRIMKFKRKWLRNGQELEWRQTNKRKVKDIPQATSAGMVNKGKHVTPERLIISKYWRMNCLKLKKYCCATAVKEKGITSIRCGSSASWKGEEWLHFKNEDWCKVLNINYMCYLSYCMMDLHEPQRRCLSSGCQERAILIFVHNTHTTLQWKPCHDNRCHLFAHVLVTEHKEAETGFNV